jgi:hypothetical protein
MDTLLDDLRDEYPSSLSPEGKPTVLCIGGKWEIDALAGEMLAHALAFEGIAAASQPAASVNADYLAKLDLKGADIVCLSYFTPNPAIPVATPAGVCEGDGRICESSLRYGRLRRSC